MFHFIASYFISYKEEMGGPPALLGARGHSQEQTSLPPGYGQRREYPYPWKGRPELRCLLTSLSALWQNPLKTRANRRTLRALFFNTVHSCSPGVTGPIEP